LEHGDRLERFHKTPNIPSPNKDITTRRKHRRVRKLIEKSSSPESCLLVTEVFVSLTGQERLPATIPGMILE
jgi:hypothetical protein